MNHSVILKDIDIFSQLSDHERERLQAVIIEESFPKGTFIFHKHSVGDKFYIIKVGTVEIRKEAGENRRVTWLARLKQGEIFGEMSFFNEEHHSADAISAGPGDAELLCIGKSDFNQLMDQDQALVIKVLRAILRKISLRLRQADEILQFLLPADHPYRHRA